MTRTRAGAAGFTLLELLIALSLSVLVVGMLALGTRSVVADWRREQGFLDESVDASLALLQLERALFGAFPHSYVSREALQRFVYFHGDGESLRFVSTVSLQSGGALSAWSLANGEAGVLLRLAPALSDKPDARLDAAPERLLLPHWQARFRYLVQRTAQEKEWLDEWPAETFQSLPLAVEVVLEPLAETGRENSVTVLATLPAWRHENIPPTIPVL